MVALVDWTEVPLSGRRSALCAMRCSWGECAGERSAVRQPAAPPPRPPVRPRSPLTLLQLLSCVIQVYPRCSSISSASFDDFLQLLKCKSSLQNGRRRSRFRQGRTGTERHWKCSEAKASRRYPSSGCFHFIVRRRRLFQLVWDGIQVEPGMTISTRNLKNAPRFNLPGADPESTFSLLMIGELTVLALP